MPYLIKLKELVLDILFPPICLACQTLLKTEEKSNAVCANCLTKIVIHTTLFCGVCRARLPENKKICHKDSPYLLGAATNYEEPMRSLIQTFKYKSWGRLQIPIKKILIEYLENLRSLKNFIVIPIPLHKNREQKRGFNQAALIGKIVADYFRLPLLENILIRVKETQSQADLKDWGKRKENLSGAFTIVNPEKIQNKNIVIVDDVYTSGATINEATQILKTAGAKKIIALVVAKTK